MFGMLIEDHVDRMRKREMLIDLSKVITYNEVESNNEVTGF